jgi:hypothetical protein
VPSLVGAGCLGPRPLGIGSLDPFVAEYKLVDQPVDVGLHVGFVDTLQMYADLGHVMI